MVEGGEGAGRQALFVQHRGGEDPGFAPGEAHPCHTHPQRLGAELLVAAVAVLLPGGCRVISALGYSEWQNDSAAAKPERLRRMQKSTSLARCRAISEKAG